MKNAVQVVVNKCNAQTCIQGLGNLSTQHLGYIERGAVDELAFFWANKLLAKAITSPMLEITLGQLQLTFRQPCYIALTGADCAAYKQPSNANTTNQPLKQKLANWQVHAIAAGDVVLLAMPKSGLRSYLAFAGNIDSLTNTNAISNSTQLANCLLNGTTLTAGACLNIGQLKPPQHSVMVAKRYQTHYADNLILEYIPNVCLSAPVGWQHLFHRHSYVIDSASNRMGYRLQGQALPVNATQTLSTPTCLGAIQVPNDGQPIVLMKDRQTIGGYPVIGCITRQSSWALSQRRPGQRVTFKPTSLEKASASLKQVYDFFSLSASDEEVMSGHVVNEDTT